MADFDSRILAIHRMRVNVKSLAAEATIIRKEAKRCGIRYESALTLHRTGKLRIESRYAQLALAFVRRKPYKETEKGCKEPVSIKKLVDKIERFYHAKAAEVAEWLRAA